MGVHRDTLAASMQGADLVWMHEPAELDWPLAEVAEVLDVPVTVSGSVDAIVAAVVQAARSGDHILVMSNGGFGGIHQKLLDSLDG